LIWPEVEDRFGPDTDRVVIKDVNVSWLSDIAATKDCTLCSFIVRLLGSWRRKHCYIMGGITRVTDTGMRKLWDLTVMFHDNNGVEGDKAEIRLCADSANAVDNDEAIYDLARPVGRLQCRSDFFKECYEECTVRHGWKCERPKPILLSEEKIGAVFSPMVSDIRLIDMRNSCIALASPGCRYVALSYMFGTLISNFGC